MESLTQSGSIAILASGPVRLLSLSLPRSEKSLAPNRRANSSILEKLPALPFSDLSTSIVLKSRHPNSSRILSAALRFSPLPRSPPCLASYLPLLAVLAHSTFHPPFPSRQPPNFESACSTFFPLNSFAKSSNRLYLRPSTRRHTPNADAPSIVYRSSPIASKKSLNLSSSKRFGSRARRSNYVRSSM